MLLLHGFPEFWYEWRNLMPAFENEFLVVAPDLRGYNLSDKPARVEDYAVSCLIGDVSGLIDHYSNEGKATIVGHDWGGVVAWAFAIAHPDSVEKLIIINAPHPAIFMRELALNPEQEKASGYIHKFKMPEAESRLSEDGFARLKRMVFETASHPEVFPSDVQNEYVKAWSQAGALTGGLNYYRASRIFPDKPPDFLEKLVVSVPTLVIWGERDKALLTGNLDGLQDYVPDLMIQRIPGGTHWVIHEEPDRVTGLIRSFLITDS